MSRPAKQSMGVMQMRLVVEGGDHDADVSCYRDVLGAAGGAARRLTQTVADLCAPPTRTPWDSANSRLARPAGLQLTLFEEVAPDGRPPQLDIAPTRWPGAVTARTHDN